MTSRRGRRKHTRFNRSYEIPRPRAGTPLTCEQCGLPIECSEDDTLKAFMNHTCKEK